MAIKFVNPFKKKREIILDPSSVAGHKVNEFLKTQVIQQKAEIDKLNLELAKFKTTEETQEREERVKQVLNEKQEELQKIHSTKYFSLGNFYRDVIKNRKMPEIFITDFDRGTKLDKWKDFGFTEDGVFVVIGENGIIHGREKITEIFQSIRGLGNDVRAGIMPLWLDKNKEGIENLIEYEIPEANKVGDKIVYHKVRKRPLYEIVEDKNMRIRELQEDLEDQEELNLELQQKVDDLERALRLREISQESMQVQMSKTEIASSNVEKAFNDLIKRLEREKNKVIICEEEIEKLEVQLKKMMREAERQGVKISDEKALETIQNIRRELVRDEPRPKEPETNSHLTQNATMSE